MVEPTVIAAALLWLRNHYDVGSPDLKDKVLKRIDRVLEQCTPSHGDMERFRWLFPDD